MATKKELNNKKQYGFPDEAEIERVIKRVTQPGYRRINKGLKPDASEQDKVKEIYLNFSKDASAFISGEMNC